MIWVDVTLVAAGLVSPILVGGFLYIIVTHLNGIQQSEDHIDEQVHAIHEAMLLWNYGDRDEALKLLAEHDICVRERVDG